MIRALLQQEYLQLMAASPFLIK